LLFGPLLVTAVHQTGMSERAWASTSGGVLGKMISPQNLAVGAAAVGVRPRWRTVLKGGVGQGNRVAPGVPHRLAASDAGARMDGAMTPAVATRLP
jgi:hypothetical protein